MAKHTQILTWATAALFVVSGAGYIVFPPFYEEGIWKIIVPVLGTTDIVAAYALLKDNTKLKRYSRRARESKAMARSPR